MGNLTNVVYPSGTTSVKLQYDPLNRVTNLTDAVGTTLFGYASGGLLASEDGPCPLRGRLSPTRRQATDLRTK